MWSSKCKNDTIYIYITSIQMMCLFYLWCFNVKYVWFTFELNLCNYHDAILNIVMQFLCIKYEHSRMSFKNNVSFIWIFNILNTYKYHLY